MLAALPGIGRSTAGAILALSRVTTPSRSSMATPAACWPATSASRATRHSLGRSRTLWALAKACTPAERVADYTQAIMDLGSGVCTRSPAALRRVPARPGCVARAPQDRASCRRLGASCNAPIVTLGRWSAQAATRVLLERRPDDGLWGGLWSFPMFESKDEALLWLSEALAVTPPQVEEIPPMDHAFTHFDLTLHRVVVA